MRRCTDESRKREREKGYTAVGGGQALGGSWGHRAIRVKREQHGTAAESSCVQVHSRGRECWKGAVDPGSLLAGAGTCRQTWPRGSGHPEQERAVGGGWKMGESPGV